MLLAEVADPEGVQAVAEDYRQQRAQQDWQ